jgi:N utilization substance protein B
MAQTRDRARSRSAARLAAVQALYQQEMEKVPIPTLLHEFHHHRLGATIEGVEYADAEVDFFDDVVKGVHARSAELDALIAGKLAKDWSLARLDKPMRQILRAGAYELVARIDVPTGSVIPNISTSRRPSTTSARLPSSTACSTPSPRKSGASTSVLPCLGRGGGPRENAVEGRERCEPMVDPRLCRGPSTTLRAVPLPCKGRGG